MEKILDLLKRGYIIRRLDGRYGDGFVDTEALEALIKAKKVNVEQRKGLDFVVEKKNGKRHG